MEPFAVASEFAGPLIVTLLYVGLYYAFQINIAFTKLRLHKAYATKGEAFDRYFGKDREMLAADRYQLNMLEHMPPFLVLLWLNAVFVSVETATLAGGIYVGARAIYPVLMGSRVGRDVKSRIYVATAPGYLVLCWFAGALIWKTLA